MKHVLWACMLWLLASIAVLAEDLTALARVQASGTIVEDQWLGQTEVRVELSQGVPYRVLQRADPYQVIVDFREADFSAVDPGDMLPDAGRVAAVRFGPIRPGWSRLVLDLAEPLAVSEVSNADGCLERPSHADPAFEAGERGGLRELCFKPCGGGLGAPIIRIARGCA